jgi:hypothetical protein
MDIKMIKEIFDNKKYELKTEKNQYDPRVLYYKELEEKIKELDRIYKFLEENYNSIPQYGHL